MDIISNDEFRAAISEIVNQWFKRWRDHKFSKQAEWDSCIAELAEIGRRHDFKVIHMIGAALVEEIERRQDGKEG